MTREEKIEDIIENLISNWSSMNDYDKFVKSLLYDGFEGFKNFSDEMIDHEYKAVFEELIP